MCFSNIISLILISCRYNLKNKLYSMGWGNIYKRRMKVFALAVVIYLDYKVHYVSQDLISCDDWLLYFGKLCSFLFQYLVNLKVPSLPLYIYIYICRPYSKERNGQARQRRLVCGRKLMNATLSAFFVWSYSWKACG